MRFSLPGLVILVTCKSNCPVPDLNRICNEKCQESLFNCILNCSDEDVNCLSECNRDEAACTNGCPCEENCPTGCDGCLNPVCYAVLVLSTKDDENKPMVVNVHGTVDDDLSFSYGEGATAYGGCAATFLGEFWYFGGHSANNHQVSKIIGCQLIRQQDMIFEFYKGSCNTFTEPEPKVLLCFDLNRSQTCYTYDGNSYRRAGSSKYSHQYTEGMANYMGKALTTGCANKRDCYVKTELMDMSTLEWLDGPDYPFASRIYQYSTAATKDAAYIIGGKDSLVLDTIAQFKDNQWLLLGNLSKARYVHGSIVVGDETLIIGGISSDRSPLETEIWNFDTENSVMVNPTLPSGDFATGIGLYVVNVGFCKK